MAQMMRSCDWRKWDPITAEIPWESGIFSIWFNLLLTLRSANDQKVARGFLMGLAVAELT